MASPEPMWVAVLNISGRTAEKIASVHGIEEGEVRDALVCVPGLRYSVHHHPERGRRNIVRTTIRGRPVIVVLYPANDPFGDAWNLGSAYFE